jgi:hypothetical protein
LSNAFSTIISGADNRAVISQTSSSVSYNVTAGAFASISAASVAGKQLFTFNRDGTNVNCYQNGSLLGSNTTYANSSIQRSVIGRRGNAEGHYVGSISEVIIYKSDQTDNRTALEANIGEVYGIAGIPAYDDEVNGFVETWYDQSGNGNNATQLTASKQPKIVDGGTLVAGGLNFDGTNDFLRFFHLLDTDDVLYVAVVANNRDTGSRSKYVSDLFYNSTTDGGGFTFEAKTFSQSGRIAGYLDDNPANSTQLGLSSITENQTQLLSLDLSSGSSKFRLDGSLVSTLTTTMSSEDSGAVPAIGGNDTGSSALDGTIQEVIIYNSDQSANRPAIEANINNQYDIY